MAFVYGFRRGLCSSFAGHRSSPDIQAGSYAQLSSSLQGNTWKRVELKRPPEVDGMKHGTTGGHDGCRPFELCGNVSIWCLLLLSLQWFRRPSLLARNTYVIVFSQQSFFLLNTCTLVCEDTVYIYIYIYIYICMKRFLMHMIVTGSSSFAAIGLGCANFLS